MSKIFSFTSGVDNSCAENRKISKVFSFKSGVDQTIVEYPEIFNVLFY